MPSCLLKEFYSRIPPDVPEARAPTALQCPQLVLLLMWEEPPLLTCRDRDNATLPVSATVSGGTTTATGSSSRMHAHTHARTQHWAVVSLITSAKRSHVQTLQQSGGVHPHPSRTRRVCARCRWRKREFTNTYEEFSRARV